MNRYYSAKFMALLFVCACADKGKEMETFECADYDPFFKPRIFTPIMIEDGDNGDYSRIDTLRTGEFFKAKLFRQFSNVPDSNGKDMIKEFKGYHFKLLMKDDLDPLYEKSWTRMNRYIIQVNDTAYLNIPVDSIIKYADNKVKWDAGYRCVFYKENCDVGYTISGTWFLVDTNAR